MSRHMILVTDGRRYETDDDPREVGGFLEFEWNGAVHRVPMIAVRDWVSFNGTPAPTPVGATGRSLRAAPEPVGDPGVSSGTPPSPPRDADAIPSNVGQVKDFEGPLPSGHPALVGGTQMVEIGGRMVPVSDEGLPPGDTENL